VQNRLEYSRANMAIYEENLADSLSRIKDVDMAAEMVNYTKLQILQQSGTAMLAQANQSPQGVLSLLR
jgi:flagellin